MMDCAATKHRTGSVVLGGGVVFAWAVPTNGPIPTRSPADNVTPAMNRRMLFPNSFLADARHYPCVMAVCRTTRGPEILRAGRGPVVGSRRPYQEVGDERQDDGHRAAGFPAGGLRVGSRPAAPRPKSS